MFSVPEEAQSIDRATSGYPDALLCLRFIGCGDSPFYASLEKECEFNCDAATNPYACKPTENSARLKWGTGSEANLPRYVPLVITTIFLAARWDSV